MILTLIGVVFAFWASCWLGIAFCHWKWRSHEYMSGVPFSDQEKVA